MHDMTAPTFEALQRCPITGINSLHPPAVLLQGIFTDEAESHPATRLWQRKLPEIDADDCAE
jgi:hypothetical protein